VGYGTGIRELACRGRHRPAVGALQALVLRPSVPGWFWWALAAPPLWALGWLATWAGRIDVDRQFFNFGAYGAIAFTVLGGVLLARLRRRPRAERSGPRRDRSVTPRPGRRHIPRRSLEPEGWTTDQTPGAERSIAMALITRHAVPRGRSLSVPRLPRPTVRGLGLLAAVAFLLLLVDALLHPRAFFDLWAMQRVQAVDAPWLPGLMDAVEVLTDSTGAVAAWGLVLLAVLAARWWVPAMALAALPLGGAIDLAIGEFLVGRTRPHLAELARDSGNFEERSFPSGHVQGAVMLYGLLFVVARRIAFRPLRLAVQGGSLAVVALVGFARVWDGAHWPTDVLGAYALGGLLLAGLVALHARVDAAVGHLPLVRAAALPHDEGRPHAHALTSLVLFEETTVAKVYAPGLIRRCSTGSPSRRPSPTSATGRPSAPRSGAATWPAS
jgi:undecaprenyl-diphosphatase